MAISCRHNRLRSPLFIPVPEIIPLVEFFFYKFYNQLVAPQTAM